MLLKILFWLFVAIDVVGLGLFFVLGLAAAGSAETHPLAVVLVMLVVPSLVLAAAVLLFLQTQWTGWRLLALLVVSGPMRTIDRTSATVTESPAGLLSPVACGGPARSRAPRRPWA